MTTKKTRTTASNPTSDSRPLHNDVPLPAGATDRKKPAKTVQEQLLERTDNEAIRDLIREVIRW